MCKIKSTQFVYFLWCDVYLELLYSCVVRAELSPRLCGVQSFHGVGSLFKYEGLGPGARAVTQRAYEYDLSYLNLSGFCIFFD